MHVVLGALTWYYVMDYYYATNHADPREVTRWSKMLERRLMCQQMWIGDSALDIRTKYPMICTWTPTLWRSSRTQMTSTR